MSDPWFWTVAIFAVFVIGLSKSGFVASLGLIGVPVLTQVMPARDAAGMLLPLLIVMDAVAVWNFRKEANWHILRVMLPGAIAGTVVGWVLWSVVSDAVVTLFVGLVTLLSVVYFLLPRNRQPQEKSPSPLWGNVWGGFSGFTSFISHTGGPPFQIYVLPRKLDPVIYSGTTAWFFAIVNLVKLVPYYFLGQLNVANLEHDLVLAPVALVGIVIGVMLVRRVSAGFFYTLTYALIFLLSLKLIYDGVVGVFFTGAVG
jgi:uncharacterized membrane protein YfcA